MGDPPSSSITPKPKVFKTRAGIVRKTKAERDQYAKQEAERAAARATAAANADVSVAPPPKQTERRTRDSKQKDGQGSQPTESGVFGAGTGGRSGPSRKRQDAGRSEMLEGQEGTLSAENIKKDGTADRSMTGSGPATGSATSGGSKSAAAGSRHVDDGLVYDAEPDADNEPQRDIEQICLSSDEELVTDEDEDVSTGKGKAKASISKQSQPSAGLRPVRAPRTHSDKTGAQHGSTRSPQKQFKSNKMVHDDHDSDVIEDDDDDMDMDMDDEHLREQRSSRLDVSSSPELGKKLHKRSSTRTKDIRAAVATTEEKAERLRLKADIRKMKEEFVTIPKMLKSAKQDAADGPGNTDPSNDRRLLLFQFPPLVPFLTDAKSDATIQSPVMDIKREPDAPTNAAEAEENTASSMPASSKMQNKAFMTAAGPVRLPAGCVGKLRVHKSGKVTLDWGGTDMEIRHGTEVDFLQDAVLVQTPPPVSVDDESEQTKQKQTGVSYALGQVKRKLVAIPDWQKLYD